MGLVMLVRWLDARLEAAGVTDWPGLSRLVASELAAPAVVTPILAFVVAPHCQGLDRLLLGASLLAILANAAVGVARKLHTAERLHRAQVGVDAAMAAIDRARRATSAVLAALKDEVVPSLDETLAAAGAMTKDRRLSASVRGRAAKIQKACERALATLRDIVEPPHLETELYEPEQAPTSRKGLDIVALPGPTLLALASPLAVEVGPDAPAFPKFETLAPAFRTSRPLHVLVAEHDQTQEQLLRVLLGQIGIQPEIVSGRGELIEAWQREPWDLIVLDMQMPEVDGLAFARAFRKAEAQVRWAYTPILALADRPTARQIAAFGAAGMDGYVARPITASSLFAAIESTIEATGSMDVEMALVA